MKVRVVSLLSLSSVFVVAATIAPPVAKAKYSETVRYESRTITESFGSSASSSTETASRGKWNLTAEIPLETSDIQAIGPETVFEVKIGRLVSLVSLKNDARYKAGSTSAELDLRLTQYPTYDPMAVAKLKWGRDKLTVTLSPKAKESASPVATGYANSPVGEIKGTIQASIRFGERTTAFEIPFTGTLKRKSVETEMVSGQAVDIEIKGETKQ